MPRWLLPLALLAWIGAVPSCRWMDAESENDGSFRLINADALVALQADATHPVHIFDANHDEFRKKEGIIGGAVLLKDHDYDVAATLPQDKGAPLVFYCSNKL
jgi:hypothetical protein